mmetsp:Transcript_162421/g.311817  ORF Transcript_162421/g.311817 Transcript_162421/m.311817 type:complete len:228 (-) Transcript_162421:60-743(-)
MFWPQSLQGLTAPPLPLQGLTAPPLPDPWGHRAQPTSLLSLQHGQRGEPCQTCASVQLRTPSSSPRRQCRCHFHCRASGRQPFGAAASAVEQLLHRPQPCHHQSPPRLHQRSHCERRSLTAEAPGHLNPLQQRQPHPVPEQCHKRQPLHRAQLLEIPCNPAAASLGNAALLCWYHARDKHRARLHNGQAARRGHRPVAHPFQTSLAPQNVQPGKAVLGRKAPPKPTA